MACARHCSCSKARMFYCLFLGRFFIKPRIGGGNKNKMTETCTMSGEINIK